LKIVNFSWLLFADIYNCVVKIKLNKKIKNYEKICFNNWRLFACACNLGVKEPSFSLSSYVVMELAYAWYIRVNYNILLAGARAVAVVWYFNRRHSCEIKVKKLFSIKADLWFIRSAFSKNIEIDLYFV